MSGESNSLHSGGEAALIQRLDEIEKNLAAVEHERSRMFRTSVISILIILAVVGLCFVSVWNYSKNYDVEKLQEMVLDSTDEIIKRESKLLMGQLKRDDRKILREFSERVKVELENPENELQAKLTGMTDRIEKRIKERVEGRLLEALEAALKENEEAIKEEFSELEDIDLDTVFEKSKNNFIIMLHNIVEERYAEVQPSLVRSKDLVAEIVHGRGSEVLTPDNLPEVQARLMEKILELMIYDLNPNRGAQLAEGGDHE